MCLGRYYVFELPASRSLPYTAFEMHEQLISGKHIQLCVDTDAKSNWQQNQGY